MIRAHYEPIIQYAVEKEDTFLLTDDFASEIKNKFLKLMNSVVNNC